MSLDVVVFLVLAGIAIAGAVSLILQRHPIRSALSLIVVMVALAGLYLLLSAELIAAVQIIVYAGAIMVLFVFVIMLLNAGAEESTNLSRVARYGGVPLAILSTGALAWSVTSASLALAPTPSEEPATRTVSLLLFRNFAFPFELTSILILIAIIGAMVLAKRHN
jgi:NADH-quinone oxidoreductase subunit J